jgi:hypothetical protein
MPGADVGSVMDLSLQDAMIAARDWLLLPLRGDREQQSQGWAKPTGHAVRARDGVPTIFSFSEMVGPAEGAPLLTLRHRGEPGMTERIVRVRTLYDFKAPSALGGLDQLFQFDLGAAARIRLNIVRGKIGLNAVRDGAHLWIVDFKMAVGAEKCLLCKTARRVDWSRPLRRSRAKAERVIRRYARRDGGLPLRLQLALRAGAD